MMKEREEPEIFLGVYPKKMSWKFVPFSNREKCERDLFEESLLLDIQVLKLNRLLDRSTLDLGLHHDRIY